MLTKQFLRVLGLWASACCSLSLSWTSFLFCTPTNWQLRESLGLFQSGTVQLSKPGELLLQIYFLSPFPLGHRSEGDTSNLPQTSAETSTCKIYCKAKGQPTTRKEGPWIIDTCEALGAEGRGLAPGRSRPHRGCPGGGDSARRV